MKSRSNRAVIFIIVAAVHAAVIFFVAGTVENVVEAPAPAVAEVMRLVDIDEDRPPPPPVFEPAGQHISEAIAENLVETDAAPSLVVAAASSIPINLEPAAAVSEEYIPQSKISVMPRFNEKEILARLVYPPIAQRAGIDEGRVVLELFINKQGRITHLRVLKEEPEGRGFGDAALRALTGLTATPAQSNNEVVATRIRYPVRFQLK